MKKTILGTAIFLLSNSAFASPYGGDFNVALYYTCANGGYITETGAKQIAEEVSSNVINLADVLLVYRKTCDFDHADIIAKEAKGKKLDLAAYMSSIYYKCPNGSYVTASGAKQAGEETASRAIDDDVFLATYRKTCDFDMSDLVAKEERTGKLGISTFNRCLYYKCENGGYIRDTGAKQIAEEAKANTIDLELFISTYYRTCDFDGADTIAREEKRSEGNGATNPRNGNDYNNGNANNAR